MFQVMRTPRLLMTACFAVVAARTGGAQIIRQPTRVAEPASWMGFSVGFFQPQAVLDGTTGSAWQFGDALQYRVALEKSIQNQSAVGLTATFARIGMTYASLGNLSGVCAGSCDADANVTQLLATFHAGGSVIGFHQVIDLAAGATGYYNFRERTTGQRLAPKNVDLDFAMSIGYGFGYTFSPTTQFELVQDFGLGMHQREGLSGQDRTIGYQYTTRLGVRFGLGMRK
jgi:hypothetical protein